MQNWCSFYGEHELDFSTRLENSSYAIFAQIGKGKSSTVAALEWALFGKVMDTIDDGDDHILRRIRPIIDKEFYDGKEMTFALPLLSDTAFREKSFFTKVEVGFSHNKSSYILTKSAVAISDNPKSDADMNINITLNIDGEIIENICSAEEFHLESKVQPIIEEIIPHDISRFFFVKGDAIREFTGLIFGSGSNPKLRNDVNSVVGLPALKRSLDDFKRLKIQAEDEANKIASEQKGHKKISQRIDGLKLQLEEIRNGWLDDNYEKMPGLKQLEVEKESLQSRIDALEGKLGEVEKIRNLLAKREGHQEEHDARVEQLPRTVQLYRQSVNNSWKILIQKRINESVTSLQEQSISEKEINKKIDILKSELYNDENRVKHSDGSVPCPTCNRDLEKLTLEERSNLESRIQQSRSELRKLEYDYEGISGSGDKLAQLIHFRSDLEPESVANLELSIEQERKKIQDLNGLINKCSEALIELGGTEGFEQLTSEIQEHRNNLVLVEANIQSSTRIESDLNKKLNHERAELRKKSGGSNPIQSAEELVEAFRWFESVWEQSLDEYREGIRESIDQVCTERFLHWVDSPEKYSRVETTSHWGLNVFGADGNWAPLANPGHRQLLSICFIEALRHCSNIQFPMIFDNPGAAVDQETIDSVLDYYFSNPPGQFLTLAHSGGMREDEIQSKYKSSGTLVSSWRIEYGSGEKRHSEFVKL